MPSIDEVLAQRDQKLAERPQFDGGRDLILRDDKTQTSVAMAVAYSLYSGQKDDPYLEFYMAHGYPAVGKNGGQYTRLVYCPVESGHDDNYKCQGCIEGIRTKDRFAMWLYVERLLYNSLVGDEKFTPENWIDGNRYFSKPVGGVRLWDTSAWKESPLNDIHMLAKQLGDLRKTRVTLKTTATGLDKRYKFYPEMGSPPLADELYQKCVAEIKPVRQLLLEGIAVAETVVAPQEAGEPRVTPLPHLATPETAPAAENRPSLPPFKMPTSPKSLF